MATVKGKLPDKFDLAKFQGMAAPIRIRIDRRNRRSGMLEPIPLPQEVWSKEDAERIEQIVLRDVAGGGSYRGQMVDASGTIMEWSFAYPVEYYPELISPGNAGAMFTPQGPAVVPPIIAGSMPIVNPAMPPPVVPGGFQGFGQPIVPPVQHTPSYPAQGAQSMSQPFGWPFPWQQPMTPFGYQSPPPASSPREGSGSSAKIEALQRQLEATTRQADEERHARERDAQAAQMREQLAAQERKHAEDLRAMREAIEKQSQRTNPENDPVLIALKAQNDLMARKLEEQERRLEQQQAEARHREELRTIQEASQRQIDSLKEMIAQTTEKREDPRMQALIEMQRQQYETTRETARAQAESNREATRLASEQPRIMIEMMERLRAASGSEQILATVNQSYAAILEQQRNLMETAMNMGQPSSVALAEGVLTSGREVIERFIGAKQAEAIAKERTAQANANVQTQAFAAQQAMAQQAMMQAQAQQQDVYRNTDGSIPMPPPTRVQLGAAPAPIVEPEPEEEVPTTVTHVNVPTAKKSPTERDIFGPLYDEVLRLREAVRDGEASPENVASILIEAAKMISEHELKVPAFTLFAEERFAELIEILLPGVMTEFIRETLDHLGRLLQKHNVSIESDDDEDDEDDEDDDGDFIEASASETSKNGRTSART